MQAENAPDQMDWIEKINGVIASLLSSQVPEKVNIHDFANICISIVIIMIINQLYVRVCLLGLWEWMIIAPPVRVIH
jgi:hypothetical protein